MFNFKHMTPCLSHNYPQMQSKHSTTSRLFNLRTLLIMQFFTYKTSPCANGHIEGRVWTCNLRHNFLRFISTTMFPRKCVDYEMCSYACSRTKRRVSAHFWLTETCLCITLNIWHLVCHIISHRCSRNKVPHHDILTYEPFSLCNFLVTRRLHVQIVT